MCGLRSTTPVATTFALSPDVGARRCRPPPKQPVGDLPQATPPRNPPQHRSERPPAVLPVMIVNCNELWTRLVHVVYCVRGRDVLTPQPRPLPPRPAKRN